MPISPSGRITQTVASAAASTFRTLLGDATGTAATSLAGRCARTASSAASIVEPVAMPSSTTITVRPSSAGGARSPRYAASRRASSSRSRSIVSASSRSVTRIARSTDCSSSTTPPVAIAPIASSGLPGAPSFLTISTSSVTRSAFATSNATGTPPRGSASTTTSSRFA
ncbi:hypothetical protein DP49_3681 [Burkholderia pseudomallei]|nr:hypothetical protein DP49_3681 [Burkholderia pseudomallei]